MPTKLDILSLVSEYISEKHARKIWTPGKDWVQYSGPYFTEHEFVRAIGTLLDEWLVLGNEAIEFENKFPPLLGKKFGIVTNSGSSSNLLMLAAMLSKKNFKQGDKKEIIVPVAGFPTTVNPIIQLGFTPLFVDIELDTLNLDLDQVEHAALKGAKYITFAHVLGNPPNMDKVMNIVNKFGLILLEDCCDGLGSTYDGKLLGSFGKYSSCSFYPAHHMTMGEGGFVACNTKEDEKIVRSLREWGRGCYCVGKKANLSTQGSCGCRFKKWLPSLPDEIFDHKYVYEEIGYNLKPIELQCSLGLAQIDKLPMFHTKRKENHKRLTQIFTPYEEFFHFHKATDKADPSWFAFPITLKDRVPFKRSHFTCYMEDKKIQTRNYFGGNLLLQPAYSELSNAKKAKEYYPVATKVTIDTLFLGTSPVITEPQLDYVEQIVNEFFKSI
jgi:CDP-6-deoxy-D-xylo-4-hexulose-3-dehydrase